MNVYLYTQQQKIIISLVLLKTIETSLLKFLTNQNFWGRACTAGSYTTN